MIQTQVKSPKVFGILSIIFASITFFWKLISLAFSIISMVMMQGFGHVMQNNDMIGAGIFGSISSMYFVEFIKSAVFIVFSILLLVVGIGQLGYKKWAAKMSKLWSITSLVALVAISVFTIMIFMPLFDNMSKDPAFQNLPAASGGIFQYFGTLGSIITVIFMIIFYAPYPILLLVFFSKQRVKDTLTN